MLCYDFPNILWYSNFLLTLVADLTNANHNNARRKDFCHQARVVEIQGTTTIQQVTTEKTSLPIPPQLFSISSWETKWGSNFLCWTHFVGQHIFPNFLYTFCWTNEIFNQISLNFTHTFPKLFDFWKIYIQR